MLHPVKRVVVDLNGMVANGQTGTSLRTGFTQSYLRVRPSTVAVHYPTLRKQTRITGNTRWAARTIAPGVCEPINSLLIQHWS